MPENGNKSDRSNGVRNREARQWKKGQSGNPGGRPRTPVFAQACGEVLAAPVPGDRGGRTNAEGIAWKLADMARAGNGKLRAGEIGAGAGDADGDLEASGRMRLARPHTSHPLPPSCISIATAINA
jgi:hypothetical protein